MFFLSFCQSSSLEGIEDELISSLPFGKNEIERLLSIKRREARLESLAALSALRAIIEKAQISTHDLTILREEGGKPYFSNLPIYFSLSHSSGLSVAALSDSPIGIDVEQISDKRDVFRLSKRFFAPSEYSLVRESSEPILSFYSLWTRHEAFAKASGLGLASICGSPLPASAFFSQLSLSFNEKNFMLSLCALTGALESPEIINPYQELKIYELQK